MTIAKPARNRARGLIFVSAAILAAGEPASGAIITNVSIGNNFFSPANVRISVNDQVRWVWPLAGSNPHSTTSDGGLWDSGVHGNGFTFTNLFTAAGTFPYRCTIHVTQTGSVIVQPAANTAPSVAIVSPTNGAIFASPWTGSIQATASDADGTVAKVDFYRGTTLLGTVSNPAPTLSFTVTNLGAGTHQLKGVATDNLGATNSSAVVSVSVVTPAPIVISSPRRTGPGTFQFTYSTTPGLRYIVQKTAALPNWTAIATNLAAGNSLPFTDNGALGPLNFYSVRVAPNP